MARALPITGEYPPDWKQISDATWAAAGHRCIRCGHPYQKGEQGKGEWTACGTFCTHGGPFGMIRDGIITSIPDKTAQFERIACRQMFARWRIGTVHHFDGNKENCRWWNLLPLCQRCHLKTQARVNPQQPYMFEHSTWLQPYVAGFYAMKYEGKQLTREEVLAQLDRLLAWERIA